MFLEDLGNGEKMKTGKMDVHMETGHQAGGRSLGSALLRALTDPLTWQNLKGQGSRPHRRAPSARETHLVRHC